MPRAEFKAVVLDLYDTLVKWEPQRLPLMEWKGRMIHSTIPWLTPKLKEAFDGRISLEDYLEIYHGVIDEINAERRRRGIEVTCHERFVRALSRVGYKPADRIEALAGDLARAHMAGVRSVTFAPADRVAAVRRLAPSFRLGLLSNFDDARTAREVLRDTGTAGFFEAIIISAEVGLRKPNPKIFERILTMLGLEAHEVLFVGDTPHEDIAGAAGVGMPVVWLNDNKGPLTEGIPAPDFVLKDLTELPALLGV